MVQVPVLAIHGGAGTINREALSAEAEREYRGALQSILEKGRDALAAGASALDAVTLAVSMLEDCPLFNAGRGAVYTSAETHEMDAAIMDGRPVCSAAPRDRRREEGWGVYSNQISPLRVKRKSCLA